MARIKRTVALLAGKQLAVSQALSSQLRGKLELVGNPYDDSFFKPVPGIARDADLLFLGRLTHDKGVDLAIRALPRILQARPSATLSIIGKGEERQKLEHLADELDVRAHVKFLGPLFGSELLAEMSRHKVVLVPSRNSESFGIVVLEATACGCVVIASECGGLPEAVGPTGLTFPVNDITSLADRALQVLQSDELRDSLRGAARKHLENFSADAVAKRYLNALSDVMKSKNAAKS